MPFGGWGKFPLTVLSRGSESRQRAWALDANYTLERLRLFAEVDRSTGVQNATRYVSGGPSRRTTDVLAGATYRIGIITWRIAWSQGLDREPAGHQSLWVPGLTIALRPNITLYAEYVRWIVTRMSGASGVLEDGFQIALNWHL